MKVSIRKKHQRYNAPELSGNSRCTTQQTEHPLHEVCQSHNKVHQNASAVRSLPVRRKTTSDDALVSTAMFRSTS